MTAFVSHWVGSDGVPMRKHQRITGNDNRIGLDKTRLSYTQKTNTKNKPRKTKLEIDAQEWADFLYSEFQREKTLSELSQDNTIKNAYI